MWKIAHISVAYSSRAVDSGSCSLPRSVRAEVVSCCSPQAVPFSWDFILTSLDSLGIGLATQTQHWGTLKFLSIGMSQLCSPSLRRLSIQLDSFLHRTYLCNLCSLNTPRGFSHASLINIHLPPPRSNRDFEVYYQSSQWDFLTSLLPPRLFWMEPVLFASVLSVNF